MALGAFEPGGYRFIKGQFQYSGGVSALPGFEIVRVRFRAPPRLAEGFARIETLLGEAGRPLTAFCACELRSPAPFTDAGFESFNRGYVTTLQKWGIFDGRLNPVARSNVCPEIDPPAEPMFHAFSYTVPAKSDAPSFVIAGSGEAREGPGRYSERTIRNGDTGVEGMTEKGRFVVGAMEYRMQLLEHDWSQTTATQVYTVYDLHPFFADEIVRKGAANAGLTWHFCRPPVKGLDFEMDCRAVATELVV